MNRVRRLTNMEDGVKVSASRLQKVERKVIEKNRRNQMKLLYSQLYSLLPPNFISKGGQGVSDRVDMTIDYIRTLENNLQMSKNKKEKLLSKKISHENPKINNIPCKPLDIQVHEMSHDLDAVLVTGLDSYSTFSDVVRLLSRYSTELTVANFSSNGHSIFHIRQKKIGANDICKRLKNLGEECANIKELDNAMFCNEVEPDLSVWDFDFQPSVWGCELEKILKGNV